ncbi:hypothetical protein G7Z17_g4118 [Cylindrodendrum hubeiense]|uniref:BZIP domain-containing protein n=1 Tax=Cylindrodendrum hubeiense TaxID=595255 RepID=A0A9P5HEK8_9HYPO|nr:hypothetical protein G7Z17_g4118 [Cylindrodendrum hubeiense]
MLLLALLADVSATSELVLICIIVLLPTSSVSESPDTTIPTNSQSSPPVIATAYLQPQTRGIKTHYRSEMDSTSSVSYTFSYSDRAELLYPARYPPIDAKAEGSFHNVAVLTGESTFGALRVPPDLLFEQWWSTDQSVPVGSLEGGDGATSVYTQANSLPGVYTCSYDADSVNGHLTCQIPNTEYTSVPSVAKQAVFKESTTPVERPELPTAEKNPEGGRGKYNFDEHSTQSFTKQSSVQNKEIKAPSRRISGSSKRPSNNRGSSGSSGSSKDTNMNKKDRKKRDSTKNRIAAKKSRAKKKEGLFKLTADVEEMKRTNHQLTDDVADLTDTIYKIKMQLLQHSYCDCVMIQEHIKNEAHRYTMRVEELSPEEGKETNNGAESRIEAGLNELDRSTPEGL